MASKKKRGGRDDFNWDDDLDFDIPDFGGDNPEAVKKDRKPIATGVKSAAAGFGKTFTSEARLRKTLTKSLPKEYEEPISKAFEIKDGVRDLYNTSTTQANEITRETKRSVGRIARNLESALPKKLAEKLKAWGDSADSDTVGSQSKSEIEQGTIDTAFASIFAQTQQAQADNEKKRDARQVIQDQIDQKRHKDMTSILGSIDNSLLQLATFQDKIQTNYLKKSLELQFRSYFVQNDMLQLQAKFFEEFKTDLQAITKNTGLPDYVKKAPKEALLEHLREKTFDSLANSISKRRSQWLSGVFKKAQGKLTDTLGGLREGLSMVLDTVESGSSMYGSGFGPSAEELIGDTAGSFAGNKAQDWIAKKIRAQMLKNPKAVKYGNKLSQIFGNLPQFVGNEIENGKYADKLPEWLKDILKPETESAGIRTNHEVDLDRAARWSDKNSRSLNIVIPELLSKIHHELYVTRTGDVKSAPLSYDYEKGKFVSQKDRQNQLANTIVSGRAKDATKHQIDSIFKEIDPEGNIDTKARQAIAEGIYGANKRNVYFNRENMLSHGVLGDHPEARKKFEEYLDKDKSGAHERRLAKMFGNVGAYNGEVKDVIQTLIDQGRHGELADMGILDLKNGRINLDMIRRMELGGGWEQAASESGANPIVGPGGAFGPQLPHGFNPNGGGPRPKLFGPKNQRGFINLGALFGGNKAKPQVGDKMIPGNAGDISEVSKMFREVIDSLNKVAKSGELGGSGIKGIEKAIEKASGKSELAEIRDILKRIEEKGIVGVNMTPEMLEEYFKGKLNNVTGYFGKGGQALKSGAGKLGKFAWDSIKGSYNRTRAIGKSIGKAVFGAGQGAFNWLAEQKDKFDLYIGNEVEPRLSKAKLEAGRYIDEATGKVITKFEDIKGAVKDLDTGEIVLKASEVKDAILKNFETGKSVLLRLTSWGKKSIKTAMDSIKKTADKLMNFSKSTYGMAWAGLKKAYERFTDGPQDVYLKDNYETPVLLKRIMVQGLYFDKDTLDPITKVSQIKGPVIDNEENVLITKEDLHNGLYDKNGQEIKTGFDKITQYIGNSIKNSINTYKKILGKGKDIGMRAMAWLKGLFGFDSPFTVFSSRTNDILTAIYALLNDRMPGERSPDLDSMIGKNPSSGGTGATVKQAGKAAGAFKEGFMKRWRRGKDQAQAKYDELKDRLPGDIERAKKAGGELRRDAKDKIDEWKDQHWDPAEQQVRERLGLGKDRVVDGLHAVVDTLRERLPKMKAKVEGDIDGDGIREGSIDDIRKKRAAAKQEKENEKKEAAAVAEKGSEKGAFAALANFFKKKKDGDDEDKDKDHSILGDVADAVEGDGGGKGKKRGRIGRGWDKLKGKMTPKGKGLGSRMLRGAGRLAMGVGKLGLKGAGLLLGGGLLSAETLLGGLSLVGSALGMAGTALGAIISSPVTVPLLIAAGVGAAGYFAYKWLTKPDPQPIEKVRLVQYGFKAGDIEAYKKMKSMEQLVKDAVVFKGENAEFDPKKVNLQEAMKLYGLNPTDSDHAKKFVDWFANRFRPIYLQHRALIKTSQSPKPLEDVDSNKPDFKKSYLDQCLFPGGHYSVTTNPFKDQAYLYTSQYTVEKQIKAAQEEVAKEGTKKDDKTKPDMPAGSAAAAAMAKNEAAKKALEKEQTKDKTSTAGVPKLDPNHDPDKVSAFKRLIAATTGANAAPGGPGRAPGDPISGPAGPKGESSQGSAKFDAGGLNVKQPGNGTGGDINAVPIPKGNGNWAALKDTIVTASKMAGVDPKLSAAITAVESGFDYTARPMDKKTGKLFSSAKGLNQFIDGTWNTMMSKYAKKYGIDPSTSAMDPRANALMGAEFIKENMAGLKQAVKRDLTATDVYIAHFMGLGGARKFLTADPNAAGASLFPDAAKANPWIYFKDAKTMTQPKTLGEIYGDFTQKLSKKLQAAGYSDSDIAGIGADPAKTKAENEKLQASQGAGPSGSGTGGTVNPGAPVASPKPTTPNSIANNPNVGPVPSAYQQETKAPKAAGLVDSPRPSYDPSAGGGAPVMAASPAPSQSQYVRQNTQLNAGDSLDIMKQSLKEEQTHTGLLQRIADGIDKLNARFDKNMGATQADTTPPVPDEKNNYGKNSTPMTAPSIGFRRALAGS